MKTKKIGRPRGYQNKRYTVTLDMDAKTDAKTVKREINYALNMAIVDAEYYDLHLTHVCKIKVQKKVD